MTKQIAHAYLFFGSRGTGKTTCAKIFAKAVNCSSPTKNGPCLECESCRAIDAGTPDVLEIDAASNNGVAEVAALRDSINYLPIICKYKVYILDEVHMFSSGAWNALLKTIEEPPPHALFILATTETHKVPLTILSRCQRFDFHRIDGGECADRLLSVAEKEGINLDREAALLIARLSDGGMRDALSMLDTAISATADIQVGGGVTADIVRESSGVVGRQHLFGIAEGILRGDIIAVLRIINELHNKSKDLLRLFEELLLHFRNIMMLQTAGGAAADLLTLLPGDMPDYTAQAQAFKLPQVLLIL